MAEHGVIYNRLMNCSYWHNVIRYNQLKKQPWCEECLKHGVIRGLGNEKMEVHHIVEVEDGRSEQEQRELAYAESTYLTDKNGQIIYDNGHGAMGPPVRLSGNLMTLCARCHHKYHKEKKSHSKEGHKKRTDARFSVWLENQLGTSDKNG